MDATFENIIKLERKRISARMNGKKLAKNIGNYGIKKGGIAVVDRKGEYHGLSIQALDDVLPIFTNYRMAHAVKYIEISNIIEAQHMLYVKNTRELFYVVKKWLDKFDFKIPEKIEKNYAKIDMKQIDVKNLNIRLSSDRSTSLPCKLKIIDIGDSKGKRTVVPESWIDREFKSGDDLHKQMSSLEWRRNKPEVVYCCTYGLVISDNKIWITYDDALKITPQYAILIANEQNIIYSNFISSKNAEMVDNIKYEKWMKDNEINNYDILNGKKFIIACNKDKLFNVKTIYGEKNRNVGYLVSCMQKCIRRGSTCSSLLCNVMKELNTCKSYNLPEHNFMKVSGTKQLLWRLFISTIEDSSVYTCETTMYQLAFIFAVSMICHVDSSLQLNDNIITKLCHTALIIQSYKTDWHWRNGTAKDITSDDVNTFEENQLINTLKFALIHTPMMKGDREMLLRSISMLRKLDGNIPHFTNISSKITKILSMHKKTDEITCMIESNDMHCFPNIILLIQGSTSKPCQKTTKEIPSIIWNHISRNNFRTANIEPTEDTKDVVNATKNIQTYIYNIGSKNLDYTKLEKMDEQLRTIFSQHVDERECQIDNNMDVFARRTAFLLIFGKKMHMGGSGKFKSVDVIVGGDDKIPLKIKKVSTRNKYQFIVDDTRCNYEKEFVKTLNQPLKIELPSAPAGYIWKFDKKYVFIQIAIDNKDAEKDKLNKISFYVNDEKIEPFDGHKLLLKIPNAPSLENNEIIEKIIKQTLYVSDEIQNHFESNLIARYIWKIREAYHNYAVTAWTKYAKRSKLSNDVWKIINSRLILGDEINIGPVDRKGEKTLNSISYEYEGIIWRIMNMLAMLYPETIRISGTFKYIINKNTYGYQHLIDELQKLEITTNTGNANSKTIKKIVPKIQTKLWDHQQSSSNKIFEGITELHKKGHCDASCVGSGKTLVALSVIAKLMQYNIEMNSEHCGALILLPTEKLYNTWIDEINNHTKRFNVCRQYADGHFDGKIQYNTIVITTLGRMRDHPIIHKWLYVVIDECLSVQNSASLHTEEAWRQVSNSLCGVLLLSASFFRSRFDKLLYMLRMLRTELPEEVEYLDTILNECIVCYIEEKNRKWYTNVNRFVLSNDIRKKYDEILNSDDSYETKYIRLNKLMYDKCDYINNFKEIVKNIGTHRALIYAKSKDEADEISHVVKNVSRYPNKTKQHVVLSYAEGTYGLNDLVIYDTIITRPPDADKLPQMKGRLDRPNQKNSELYVEFLLFENTIEEAMIYKLEMSKKFHGQYILPLAEFYKIAIEQHTTK